MSKAKTRAVENGKKKNKWKTKEELIKEYAYGNHNQIETAFPKQVQYSHNDQFFFFLI